MCESLIIFYTFSQKLINLEKIKSRVFLYINGIPRKKYNDGIENRIKVFDQVKYFDAQTFFWYLLTMIMLFLCIKYFDVTSIYEMLSKCNLGIDCELRHLNFSSACSTFNLQLRIQRSVNFLYGRNLRVHYLLILPPVQNDSWRTIAVYGQHFLSAIHRQFISLKPVNKVIG